MTGASPHTAEWAFARPQQVSCCSDWDTDGCGPRSRDGGGFQPLGGVWGRGAWRTSSATRGAVSSARRRSHRGSLRDELDKVGGEGGAGNKFHFIVEMEICIMALEICFYVCVCVMPFISDVAS